VSPRKTLSTLALRKPNVLAYNGKPLFVSSLIGQRQFPRRSYLRRDWMTDAHHARVQKKWNKRFGTDLRDQMIITPEAIFCSEQTYQMLKQQLGT